MFHLTEVLLRLRAECPVFERRVGGTAAFKAANQPNANMKMPHAFVVPMVENAEQKNASGTAQRVLERFAIIIAVDNSFNEKDGAGMNAQQTVTLARAQLINALLAWEAAPWCDTIQFNRGIHLDMKETRLWHQFEWSFAYYIDTDRAAEESEPAYAAAALKQLFIAYRNEEPVDKLFTIDESPADRLDEPLVHPVPNPAEFPGPSFHGGHIGLIEITGKGDEG